MTSASNQTGESIAQPREAESGRGRAGGFAALIAALLAVAAIAWCGWQTYTLFWTCDDAFISLRYAENLVAGEGLVFNAGERVEGYSNFSWTMLLAAAKACGIDDLAKFSSWLGLAFWLGTLGLLWRASALRACAAGVIAVPIALIGLAMHHHGSSLAPAGLETAMFTCLLTWLWLGTASKPRGLRAGMLLGLVGVLLAMTRPDGALPCAIAGAVLLLDAWRVDGSRTDFRGLIGFVAAFALLFVPWFVWKWGYYGYPFPNTFYAKSGDKPYLGQGWLYVQTYFTTYWILIVGALGLVVWTLFGQGRRRVAWRGEGLVQQPAVSPWQGRRPVALAAVMVASYLAFVVWVGGDFMFARFALPVTPLLFFGIEVLVVALLRRFAVAAPMQIVAGVLVAAATWFATMPEALNHYQADKNSYGFSDNRAISVKLFQGEPMTVVSARVGRLVGELTKGLDFKVAIHGSHANLAYYGAFPVVIETAAGLTDEHIAHLEVTERAMVGHERHFDMFAGYLESRGVDINLHLAWRCGHDLLDAITGVVLGHADHPGDLLPARMVTYRHEVWTEIRRRSPGIVALDFTQWFDDVYLKLMDSRTREQLQSDMAAFDRFYFGHNDDPARRAVIQSQLKR